MIIRILTYFAILCVVVILLLPVIVFKQGASRVYLQATAVENTPVAIVFGAGLTKNNKPSDALMDRLTVTAELIKNGTVARILVSGDNSTIRYNEPEVMKRTLVDVFNVNEELISVDYAGRRTYDTCRRAHDLWGVQNAILVTQGYHLPRAIWTCRALGIESTGISATLQSYTKEIPFKIRELGAIYKAFIDLYLIEPTYVGGDFIEDLDP